MFSARGLANFNHLEEDIDYQLKGLRGLVIAYSDTKPFILPWIVKGTHTFQWRPEQLRICEGTYRRRSFEEDSSKDTCRWRMLLPRWLFRRTRFPFKEGYVREKPPHSHFPRPSPFPSPPSTCIGTRRLRQHIYARIMCSLGTRAHSTCSTGYALRGTLMSTTTWAPHIDE